MLQLASHWFLQGLGVAILVYSMAAAAVFFGQRGLIYFPDDRPLEACNLPEGVTMWHADTERGLFTGSDHPRLLVFFQGNAGSACSWRFLGVNHLEPLGYDVLVVEYPGYSGDPRQPSRANIGLAVRVVGDWVAAQDYERVVVMGFSLGTGAASLFARDFPADQVILFAPFDSIYNLAWAQGFLFPRFLLQEDFNNMVALAGVSAPIYILHGGADRVVPVRHSANLSQVLREAGRNVQRLILDGAPHHGLFDSPAFDRYMRNILGQ